MRNLPWTPLARLIGLVIEVVLVIGIGWVLFIGTWFILGGK